MYCLNCRRVFDKKINIKNIFKNEVTNICESCFMKMDMINHFDIIPIQNSLLINYTIFSIKQINNINSLSEYINPYLLYFIKNKKEEILYISDKNDDNTIETLMNLNLGNIHHIIIYEEKQRRIL